jgi:hypothetical protein
MSPLRRAVLLASLVAVPCATGCSSKCGELEAFLPAAVAENFQGIGTRHATGWETCDAEYGSFLTYSRSSNSMLFTTSIQGDPDPLINLIIFEGSLPVSSFVAGDRFSHEAGTLSITVAWGPMSKDPASLTAGSYEIKEVHQPSAPLIGSVSDDQLRYLVAWDWTFGDPSKGDSAGPWYTFSGEDWMWVVSTP